MVDVGTSEVSESAEGNGTGPPLRQLTRTRPMTLEEITKANELMHQLDDAAESLLRINEETPAGFLYSMHPGHPAYASLVEAMRKVVADHHLMTVTNCKAALAELGVFPTDTEIKTRAEAAETGRKERRARYHEEVELRNKAEGVKG
jgi:hypothetical protein